MKNLYELPEKLNNEEVFEPLASGGDVLIERIVSTGQATPEGQWYDQERDEWVALLRGEAELRFEDGEILRMAEGDWLLIPAHRRHRVEWTSSDPPCIWIAVHGNFT